MSGFNGFGEGDSSPADGLIDSVKGFKAPSEQQAIPQERVVHERTPAQEDLAEFQAEMELLDRASKTKFSTGNPERDRHLYLRFRAITDSLTDMLDG